MSVFVRIQAKVKELEFYKIFAPIIFQKTSPICMCLVSEMFDFIESRFKRFGVKVPVFIES